VVVGDELGGPGELEHLVAAAGDPVAAVGVRPRDGTLLLHVLGDGHELLAIFRGVPVEVIPVPFPIVVVGILLDAHGVVLSCCLQTERWDVQKREMACSGQEWAASLTCSS
jgi:hypothetical protein